MSEGFSVTEVRKQFPKIPKSTLYDWAKEFRNLSESGAGRSRQRMPIDPESPLDKICNALWDIVHEPEKKGAAVAVQALRALLQAEQSRATIPSLSGQEENNDEIKITIERHIVDVETSDRTA